MLAYTTINYYYFISLAIRRNVKRIQTPFTIENHLIVILHMMSIPTCLSLLSRLLYHTENKTVIMKTLNL